MTNKFWFLHPNLPPPKQIQKQNTFNILLTLYHINIALNAFSFEQDPQDMVITCGRPLGATCQWREQITPKY